MQKFIDYLESGECYELLKGNKSRIHIETRDIFLDNVNRKYSRF